MLEGMNVETEPSLSRYVLKFCTHPERQTLTFSLKWEGAKGKIHYLPLNSVNVAKLTIARPFFTVSLRWKAKWKAYPGYTFPLPFNAVFPYTHTRLKHIRNTLVFFATPIKNPRRFSFTPVMASMIIFSPSNSSNDLQSSHIVKHAHTTISYYS